ncbi:hypothetical protein E2C01_070835 [Portunus trituberculatus]|uniref:Uncharacterized protein n=1 Tax=Portunus trituberculatus TaxID=210409 RepID=A0A5B7I6I3_PORTR|nr:hypothetical protein [Portunus trituberculatus]
MAVGVGRAFTKPHLSYRKTSLYKALSNPKRLPNSKLPSDVGEVTAESLPPCVLPSQCGVWPGAAGGWLCGCSCFLTLTHHSVLGKCWWCCLTLTRLPVVQLTQCQWRPDTLGAATVLAWHACHWLVPFLSATSETTLLRHMKEESSLWQRVSF